MRCRNVLVVLLILSVVAWVFGPSAFAAKTNGRSSAKQEMTLLDPFTLMSVAVQIEGITLTRQAIRTPTRPACRSAFRPSW